MKRTIISIFLAASIAGHAYSQNAGDALRYSRQFTGGTARFMAMGGAFGALGADFTTISTNPGGLGLYKSSDFVFTPSIHVGSSTSLYNGNEGSDSRTNFAVGNVGYVATRKLSSRANAPGFRYVQFAMGLNRINDYNRRYVMQGANMENSLLDTYVEYADGIFYRNIEDNIKGEYGYDLQPAWYTWLLDTYDTINNIYFSPIPNGGTMQQKVVDQWGSMNEWSFSFGANYEEILYIGMSFNIPWIRYFERSTYSEVDVADTIGIDFDSFYIDDRLETRGTGFNFKFGFILRAANFLRIGGSMHTPTWFNMRDYWDRYTESYFDNGDSYYFTSPSGYYRYKLTTPLRLQGSLAILFGKHGLISGEYEFVDYSSAKFNSYEYAFNNENNDIKESYEKGHNIKVGTEWRTGPLSFRAGYNYYSSPFKAGLNDGSINAYSGGIGIKEKFYYIDFAYVYSVSDEDYYFYGSNNTMPNPVENELIDHRFLITVGMRF